ncbi:ferritin heavy chain-like [Rattus norvegicus]|uniref:Ferritin heavy chain-like n=1 Tax=Rattus norvegicus TaxID=10116 RepID=D4AC58_RAT|nr:ferritin heavy chain-like [Rattus norvegicus]|eukprot:XP_017453598.1 PREDICTED: ferritin heavy chain-like [Rattus norvegicus]
MGPKKGNPISEVILPLIHQVACIQMNLSDAYLYLTYLYSDDSTATGFGAYVQDKSLTSWFYAQSVLKYITGRGNKVCIPDIQRPEIDTQGRIQCAMAALNMEKELKVILHRLLDLALNIKDNQTLNHSKDWIFKQQRNEERLAREIDELKKKEQAQNRAVEDETYLQGSPRKMPRREPSASK